MKSKYRLLAFLIITVVAGLLISLARATTGPVSLSPTSGPVGTVTQISGAQSAGRHGGATVIITLASTKTN